MNSKITEPSAAEPVGPLKEPLMPQLSIRSLILAITVSAILMVVAQQAVFGEKDWAILVMILLANVVTLLVLYAVTFLLANLFSLVMAAAIHPEPIPPEHVPTPKMPEEVLAQLEPDAPSNDATEV